MDQQPPSPEVKAHLAALAARHPGWSFRFEHSLWWAEQDGALLGADSAESLRLLLAELAALPGNEA